MKYKIKITDNQKKEINISEDEIIEVKYNIGLTEKMIMQITEALLKWK